MGIEETSKALLALLSAPEPANSQPVEWPGERVQERVPFERYAKLRAVNVSTLKFMAESPLAYRDAVENGSEDKPAFALGSAAHTAVLEPRRFMEEYVVQPETRTNDKGDEVKFVRTGKHWAAFEAEHSGKRIIKQLDYDKAWDIQERVRKHPAAAAALSVPGKFEVAVTWVHPGTGLRCKCRIDHLSVEGIDELKTAADITQRGFARSVYNYNYHWQAAFCQDAVKAVTGQILPVRFIPVQSRRPYDCVLYECDEELIDIGREEYTRALERVAECLESGKWPGISDTPLTLSLPAWATQESDEIIVTEETAS